MSRITEIQISRAGEETEAAVLVYSSHVGDPADADAEEKRCCAADSAIKSIAYQAVTAEGGLERFHLYRNDTDAAGSETAVFSAARGLSLFKGVGTMRVLMIIFALALASIAGAAVVAPKGYGVNSAQVAGRAFSALEKRIIQDMLNGGTATTTT